MPDYQVVDGSASFMMENPDYNVRSLRSNVVLRWEWRPGSTLFAVWQQDGFEPLGRAADAPPGVPALQFVGSGMAPAPQPGPDTSPRGREALFW